MEYKGYHAKFSYDNEDRFFVGKVFGINDSINFHGSSVEELERMFHQSIDNYLEMCKHFNKVPDKEYTGTFNVRISPGLHKDAAMMAMKQNITLNQLVNTAIEKHVHQENVSKAVLVVKAKDLSPNEKLFHTFNNAGTFRVKGDALKWAN